MSKAKNNYLIQGSILAIASIIARLIGMLYKFPLTRMIGPAGMTYYNQACEIYNIALLLSSFSIPLAISKLIAARDQKKEYRNSMQVFRLSLILAAITGGISGFVIFFGASFFASLTGYPSAQYPLRVLAPTLLVVAIMGVFRGLFQGKKTMVPTAFSQIIEQIINAIVSIVAAILLMNVYKNSENASAYGATGGTWGTFLGAVSGLLFLMSIYYINRGYLKKKAEQDVYSEKETGASAVKVILLTLFPIILSQTVYQISGIIDSSMFGNLMRAIGMGEYERAALYEAYGNKYRQLTNIPVAIAAALSSAIVPSLSASCAVNEMRAVKQKIASSIKLNMLIAIPAAIGMAILGSQIILLLYNDSSETPGNLLAMGSISIVFFAYSTMTNGILQGINRLRTPVVHAAISLGIHVAFLYCLLKYFRLGVFGLVIGNMSFSLIICILNWITLQQVLHYKQEILKTFLLPTLAGVGMGVVCYLTYSGLFALSNSNTISMIAALLIALPVYLILVLAMKVMTTEEWCEVPFGRKIIILGRKLRLIK